ncbi:MAG: catechol 2,3-dioxygenase-like lactoylglutathione lyase family enzyme [Flavobacteriales bacterium]|jgi:catechol 2,3-dioxygenase-like lactoylglutathione lyase family enzyme
MENIQFPRMHVSLYVKDITKTVAFYSTFFNQAPIKHMPDYAKFELAAPGLIISFVQNESRVASNFGHLGIQVASPEALLKRLDTARVNKLEVFEEMGTNCCYAEQDKFWVADPDGHQWEIYFFHADATFNDPKYQSKAEEACCTPPVVEKKKVKLSELQNNTCAPGSGCC